MRYITSLVICSALVVGSLASDTSCSTKGDALVQRGQAMLKTDGKPAEQGVEENSNEEIETGSDEDSDEDEVDEDSDGDDTYERDEAPQLLTQETCAQKCSEIGYCCNQDVTISSNQYLSCYQACTLRSQGVENINCSTKGCDMGGNNGWTQCRSCSCVENTWSEKNKCVGKCAFGGVPDHEACEYGIKQFQISQDQVNVWNSRACKKGWTSWQAMMTERKKAYEDGDWPKLSKTFQRGGKLVVDGVEYKGRAKIREFMKNYFNQGYQQYFYKYDKENSLPKGKPGRRYGTVDFDVHNKKPGGKFEWEMRAVHKACYRIRKEFWTSYWPTTKPPEMTIMEKLAAAKAGIEPGDGNWPGVSPTPAPTLFEDPANDVTVPTPAPFETSNGEPDLKAAQDSMKSDEQRKVESWGAEVSSA